jgi:hypothetical protein
MEVDRVDELFARIKADRAAAVAAAAPAAATPAPEAPAAPPIPAPAESPASPTGTDESPPRPAAGGSVAADAADRATADASTGARAGEHAIQDESARNHRDELLDPAEEALARQLKRVLQDEQNEVLDRLRRKRRRHASSPLLSLDEQAARFREAAEAALEDAVRAGARFHDPERPGRGDMRIAREAAAALGTEIAEPLHERLSRALADAGGIGDDKADDAGEKERAQAGQPPADPSDAISTVYRQWRGQELERLARHHVTVAFSRAAFGEVPEGATLRWVVDDETPCPDCDDNALAGAVAKGQPYPTGQAHPPAHPGCRCILVRAVP